MNKFRSLRSSTAVLVAGLLLLFLSVAAFAQGTSNVRGTVRDPQGNVVSGANVTLTNVSTSAARTTTSNESGGFTFDLITPGDYRLDVEAKGFKKAQITDIHALVAKQTDLDVALEVGAVTETVTVSTSAGDVLLNTQDATLGNNFVNQQITQLPLEARNVLALVTLQPGVTRTGYVAGARSDQSNITLDGVDINEAQTNSIDSPVLRLNSEAVEEFRVTTVNANASAGRSSGAQISLVTKSGTNDWHASLFEFHRNTIFTANNFFNNRNGRYTATDTDVLLGLHQVGQEKNPRPKLIRNTFGGSLGGPIKKDRAFFFYSYEGRRDASETTIVQRVPLPSMGRGELRYVGSNGQIVTLTPAQITTAFPSLAVNGSSVNPAATAVLAAAAAKYPANDFTTGDSLPNQLLNTAGFRFNAPTPVQLNSHSARFDLNLTSKQQLFLRMNVIHDLVGGTRAFPDTPPQNTWSHPWGGVLGHTWTISSRFVNNFRYGITREAFDTQGDSTKNEVYFRFVFFPVNDSRSLHRTTPVQNITDDFSWISGNHTMQFGTNVRIIRNHRITFARAYDTALTNPSFYASSGTPLSSAIGSISPLGSGMSSVVQNAVSALLGRLTQYSARFNFDKEGNLLPPGTPTERTFASEEYDLYGQDVWKINRNLTVTYGLRYGLSRPIYEINGFETKPNIPLSDYFQKRLEAAARGQNYTETILLNPSGPANNAGYMYPWDKNNLQPSIAVAWSPHFKGGILGAFFGSENQSVIRGGFRMTNDYIGQALAVNFDLNNTLGFSSSTTISAGTCNTTDRPCPLFTSFAQQVRGLPGITVPSKLTFPVNTPADNARRIETGLDEKIISPVNYTWNLTFEREMPHGLVVQASYLGRLGRHLLATRDVMMPNDLVDPKSGMDWYVAAGQLEDIRRNLALQGITSASPRADVGAALQKVSAIPYFENLFSSIPFANFASFMLGSSRAAFTSNYTQVVLGDAIFFNGNDWSTTQDDIDKAALSNKVGTFFYQPQWGALSSFSTVANSNYHAGTLSIRERLGRRLTLDFNYTLSKSMDDASGLQTASSYGSAFILNPIRQHDNYSVSDFDVRHIINFNSVWQLPFGRGEWLFDTDNKIVNGILGGWQLSTIFRWNSGLPVSSPFDAATWATNWNVQSNGVRVRPIKECSDKGGVTAPKLFGCDPTYAYQSFRNAKPGETGDRNVFRLPSYVVLDAGLGKTFGMPWSEKQKLQIRWEVFNVTNTQHMGVLQGGRDGFGLVLNPQTATPPPNWTNYSGIQGTPRVMQVGFRFEF